MKELHSSGSSTTNNKMLIFLLLLFFFLSPTGGRAGAHDRDPDDECNKPAMCGDKGPEIRFPFWLKGHQPERCGYGPGFALTCSPTNNSETLVDIPFFFKAVVKDIDYLYQELTYHSSSCFDPHQNLSLIFNTSPFLEFRFNSTTFCEYYIFSCPSLLHPYYDYYTYASLPCLSRPGHHLYLMKSDSIRQNLLNCTKMHTIPSVPCIYLEYLDSSRNWTRWDNEPIDCWKCEEEGTYCRRSSSNNSKKYETECFNPKPPTTRGTSHHLILQKKRKNVLLRLSSMRTSNPIPPAGEETATNGDGSDDLFAIAVAVGEAKAPLVTGLIPPGIFLLVVLAIATYFTHRSIILKKEDQVKVERFLENYRALRPTRYTYAEIKKITHNLKEKLGQGGYGTVYKGELSNDVPIAAKILNNFTGNGDDFINEVGTIGTIHHVNVVRLVGYCADGYKKALVYEYLPNDSLEKFISTDHKKASLGWEKLQDIAIGIAKGIEYLHQGCDQRILHFDIKPHNILLDKNFIPKISDFGLAKLCSKEQSVVSMTTARGTVGYIAPEVFSRNFGNVSHKSDVYSFGMLLLEMVGGRKKNIDVRAKENSDEVYFPEWIYNRLNREEVNNNEVEEGGDAKIVKKLTVVGLWCIQWYPGDRPSMKAVVQMLEGDGGETKSPLVTGLIPTSLFVLLVLVIATYFVHRTDNKKEDQVKVERYTYAEIKKITHNFKDKLGQGGYGIVYKGELSKDVPIAAKILNNFTGNGDDFINEVGTIDKFISSDHKRASLGWQKLQDIALGIAKGNAYLHQGCDQRILHFDIKPHNILLDKNFIPKISDFGQAKLCSKEQSVVSMTAARGTVGYIAPEVFSRNFGNVSHKSDV
ncbi:hypothetical protein RHSIM_Rhsim06G0111200 [Rhododendron simsii]|uniref:non-specific serine/threonine protein kinase n=1 Tax=Rhododendron simsii TaxID=118357 RepID=A0A834GTA4_RHOSS|nr:hypothetical protein RHSIM_Rhsim06G0111200 [Rhododendron simsii]